MNETNEQTKEPNLRLKIKQSVEGMKCYEYTITADTIEELTYRLQQVKVIAENECIEEQDYKKIIRNKGR